jgi:exonuclease III
MYLFNQMMWDHQRQLLDNPAEPMSLLAWNFQGRRDLRTVRDLRLMVKEKRPNFVFLMETKIRNPRLQKLRVSIGFEGLLTVEPVGKSGGLAILWRDNREVMIHNFSQRHISAKISLL